MITDTLYLKTEYETTRLGRYEGTKPCSHTQEMLDASYNAWADAPMGREKEWDVYCDVRDGYPLGTNRRIRRKRELQQRIVFVQ